MAAGGRWDVKKEGVRKGIQTKTWKMGVLWTHGTLPDELRRVPVQARAQFMLSGRLLRGPPHFEVVSETKIPITFFEGSKEVPEGALDRGHIFGFSFFF